MTSVITNRRATEIARAFFIDYVYRNRDWSTVTIEGYLPKGVRLNGTINGPITIKSVAQQIHDLAERDVR